MSTTSPIIRDLLNSVVGGRIEDYDVNLDEGKLKGENFCGEITFVSLKNKKTNETLQLVVKQILDGLGDVKTFQYYYPTEINFYKKIWPAINQIQEVSSIGFNKVAKYYGSCDTKGKEKLILEDLSYQGYRLLDKTKPLDRKHFDYIFKSYGTFHAISYAYREFYPEEFAKMGELTNKQLFNEQDMRKSSENTPENPFEPILHLFNENKDKSKLEAIQNLLTSDMIKRFFDSMDYKGDTPVLLHGDCWSNNMMFKYDKEGNITNMKFLDFQIANYGSPANDLSYCLYTGAPKDILDKLDDLLQIYIDSFTETLKQLNCKPEKPYTLEKLKNEWKEYSFFGFMLAIGIWKIKLLDKNNLPKMTEFGNDNENFVIPDVAKEHFDTYNKIIKDLFVHLYEYDLL